MGQPGEEDRPPPNNVELPLPHVLSNRLDSYYHRVYPILPPHSTLGSLTLTNITADNALLLTYALTKADLQEECIRVFCAMCEAKGGRVDIERL